MTASPHHTVRETVVGYLALAVLALFLLPLAPFIALAFLWANLRDARLVRLFRRQHPGRFGLLVYSNSPHWKRFIEERWIPLLADRCVVVNWSERSTWAAKHPLEQKVFRRFAGALEFNPIAIVLGRVAPHSERNSRNGSPTTGALDDGAEHMAYAPTAVRWAIGRLLFREREVQVIRFWRAFRDHKHGRHARLRAAELEMFTAFGVTPPDEIGVGQSSD